MQLCTITLLVGPYCSALDVQERRFTPSPLAGEGWDGGGKRGGGESLEPWQHGLYRTLLLVWLLGVPLAALRPAVAQVPHGTGEVTVDDLVARALADNLDLQATQAEVDAAHGRLQQAGLRPNPMPDLSVQKNVAGPDNNLTASVTLPLDLNGRRAGRVGVAAGELEMKRALASAAEVVLSPEAMSRAGIKTAPAEGVASQATIQLPGTVMADAYREVKVVPIVGGIVTRVHVELGAAVKRGAPLATLFSPELAEAQTKYLSMRAMLVADHQKLQRTQQLVAIGAASRQELEDITAVHVSHATEVEAARQRLLLLGLSRVHVEALANPSQIVSDVTVPAPITSVITSRTANLGQVVSLGQELFVVTDLSQVWVIGDLYEQDFQTVHVGSEAALTTPAYPTLTLRGRVTYIDPRMEPQTRTAKVRVEMPNAEGRLRLGMYVTLAFTTPGGERTIVIPRMAVQTIGERQVVFVPAPDEEGKFLSRPVQVGPLRGDLVTIRSGVQLGEAVVTEGSFFLRALKAEVVGAGPRAPYVEFRSFDAGYWSSWDRESALHKQTILAYGMNGAPLYPDHGAPLRLYSAVKLGYKMVQYLIEVHFLPERTGGYWEDQGYEWFGGI